MYELLGAETLVGKNLGGPEPWWVKALVGKNLGGWVGWWKVTTTIQNLLQNTHPGKTFRGVRTLVVMVWWVTTLVGDNLGG